MRTLREQILVSYPDPVTHAFAAGIEGRGPLIVRYERF